MAALLAAKDRAALQAALPACAADLLEADRVLLVSRDDAGLHVLASHGGSVEDLDNDAAALALQLNEPVCFDPDGHPDSSLAMPLAGHLALSCHRATPFDADAREALATLMQAVSDHWERLDGDSGLQVAALEARLRQQERKQHELAERLVRNDRLKAEFVATMSHELRTPLNVVLGFSSLLADQAFGALNAEQTEAMEKVLESSERLAGLINDLLDVSRLEAGTLHFTFLPTDLRALLQDAVDDVRPIATQRQLHLELEVPEGEHEIEADSARLCQVLAHLLDNALKFTEPGGRVGVRLIDPTPGGVAIEVWDTGIGIPETSRHRLFERFFQVDSSNTRLYGGTGLGLALVKEFVERHGGRVSLDSRVGKGSTFRLDLPKSATEALASSSVILD